MHRFDPFSNHKVLQATRTLEKVCQQIEPELRGMRLDSSVDSAGLLTRFAPLFRQAFGALSGLGSQDLRRADMGARKQLERAEQRLRDLYRSVASHQPSEAKTLSELIEQASSHDALAKDMKAMLVQDPAYRQASDAVASGGSASILAVLAAVYLLFLRKK